MNDEASFGPGDQDANVQLKKEASNGLESSGTPQPIDSRGPEVDPQSKQENGTHEEDRGDSVEMKASVEETQETSSADGITSGSKTSSPGNGLEDEGKSNSSAEPMDENDASQGTASKASVASPRMEFLAAKVVQRPWLTIALTLLLTLLALIPLQGMDTTTSLEDYLPPTDEVAAGKVAYRQFALSSSVITVIRAQDGQVDNTGQPLHVLHPQVMLELLTLEAHLANDPLVQPWLYNTSAPIFSPATLLAGTLAQQGYNLTDAPVPIYQAALEQLILSPRSADLFGRAHNGTGVWQAHSILMRVDLDKQGDYNDETSEIEVRNSIHRFTPSTLELNTMAAASDEMEQASKNTLNSLLPVSFLLMGLLITLALRRPSDTILSLVAVIMALIWMFAAGELLGLGFSQYTFIAPILVLALGVDDAIHILHRYRADFSQGKVRAMTNSIGMVGTALLLTTLTTMAAFGANRISDVPAIKDFGLLVAMGIASAFLLTTTFLPAARLVVDRRFEPKLEAMQENNWAAPVLKPVAMGAQRHGTLVVLVALLITLGSLWAANSLEQELEMVDLLEPDSELYVGYEVFLEDFSTTSGESAGILIVGQQLARPEMMQALLATQDNMINDDKVARLYGQPQALSIANYVQAAFPAFAQAQNLSDANNDSLPDDAPATRQLIALLLDQGLVHPQHGEVTTKEMRALVRTNEAGEVDGLLIQVTSANIGTLGGGELKDQLEGDIAPLKAQGVKVTVFGVPVERYQMLTSMTDGMLSSVTVSILLCLFLLMVLRRSPREGLEAILPVILVAAWVYGTLWALGWALNVVTVSIAAITIGVGVDFAVHLLHRYRESRSEGHPPLEAMSEAVEHTGQPLLGATLTTMIGFGVLFFSPMNIFSQFGLLTAFMVLYSLIATLVVLPVVILKFSKFVDEMETKEVDTY